MRRLAIAIALACVVSGVARAGEIHSTGAAAPSTPGEIPTTGAPAPPSMITTTGEIHTTALGEIPSTGAPEPEASNTILTIILTLISIG